MNAGNSRRVFLLEPIGLTLLALVLLPAFLTPSHGYAEIYKWTDENGRVHFGDKPAENVSAESVTVEVNSYTNVTYDLSQFNSSSTNNGKNAKVVMYSTSWCGYCKKARAYFEKNGIPFTEYDIETNQRAKKQYDKLGATGVPVILVGKKRMNGFSESGFSNLYN